MLIAIQFLLKPTFGKSTVNAVLKLYRYQAPLGSLVCETPMSSLPAPVVTVCMTAIQRLLYGSYIVRGSVRLARSATATTGAQKVAVPTVLSTVPVALSKIR
ncbi:MAG: hypothetical protein EBU54_15840 [Mycobacteriaceae bacterium]|nr:hypothetical protein [Mycobacteriaceae bacterium]